MDLTDFEIVMLLTMVLQGGVFIGTLFVSIKFLTKEFDELRLHLNHTLQDYKQDTKENIELIRSDMKKYNNVLSRLAVNEREIEDVKHMIQVLQNLYDSLLKTIVPNIKN